MHKLKNVQVIPFVVFFILLLVSIFFSGYFYSEISNKKILIQWNVRFLLFLVGIVFSTVVASAIKSYKCDVIRLRDISFCVFFPPFVMSVLCFF